MLKQTATHISDLRQNMTDTEKKLWHHLRAKRFKGYKFRRQHRIQPFIVDFVCLEEKLIVELDGGQHAEQVEYDRERSLRLEKKGFRVLRFWNCEVFKNLEGVLEQILFSLEKRR